MKKRLETLLDLLDSGPQPLSYLADSLGVADTDLRKSIALYESKGYIRPGPDIPAPKPTGRRVVKTWERA